MGVLMELFKKLLFYIVTSLRTDTHKFLVKKSINTRFFSKVVKNSKSTCPFRKKDKGLI